MGETERLETGIIVEHLGPAKCKGLPEEEKAVLGLANCCLCHNEDRSFCLNDIMDLAEKKDKGLLQTRVSAVLMKHTGLGGLFENQSGEFTLA
ncbi:MAG: hypothetical protein N4A38_03495 [Candidatus Gracilibacteria bacterium]|nr:hypothetical protein [Candidatus Gracilibacteria bacterium]